MTTNPFTIMNDHIDTDIGRMKLFKVDEYLDIMVYSNVLSLQRFQVMRDLQNILINKYDDYGKVLFDDFRSCELVELIRLDHDIFHGLKDTYDSLFTLCFGENVFCKIKSDKELMYYMDLIIESNGLSVEKESPDPDVEYFNQLEKMKNTGEPVTFESIYTHLWLKLGKEPKDLTLYAFFRLFDALIKEKAYNTTTLFATVSNEVKIEPWYKAYEKVEDTRVSLEELQSRGDILK